MKIILALALLLALFGVLGLCAWGTTTAATSLALAGGIAINQVTITKVTSVMALAFGLIFLVGLMFFVAVTLRVFNLGRTIERRRTDEELDARSVQHALGRAQAQKPRVATPILLIAPPQPPTRLDSPAPRQLVRRAPRVRRAASRIAKRWFSWS